jgi:choice-of-anchor A domain-containing protein
MAIQTSFVRVSLGVAIFALAGSAYADINPWDFNVFSRSTIGSSASAYGSDFEGAAGAVGNAWFGGFALRAVGGSSPSLPQSWYGGGDLHFSGQINNGGAENRGTVTLTSGTILGGLTTNGNLAGTSGSITGNATLGGIKTAPGSLTVAGTLTQNAGFVATVNLADVSAYFLAQSNAAAALANTAVATLSFGAYTVNTVPGVNVVTLSATDLLNAHTFNVNGPGTLIINVTGTSVSLDSTTWNYGGGASVRTTLLNYNQATAFSLTSGNVVNILAPNAATNFLSGNVNGNLIVGSLLGGSNSGGQVNWTGGFNGTIPAPSVAGVLALGGLVSLRRRR